ncbi:hypothetical protein QBC44DRAFT_303600 [Cladorrhinum sp. PSN332]|nr:hypothetical protein QBC44DRAFT_303600 [Cladorrhinum sp. PSN332]
MGSSGGGGYLKNWDDAELVRCGALDTNITSNPNLSNPIHPLFSNFTVSAGDDPTLLGELTLPLRLATLLLQCAGLPWLSEFFIQDIFSPTYPGYDPDLQTPSVIVRHHKASSHKKAQWIKSTSERLLSIPPSEIEWRLDSDILPTYGWVGYTARQQQQQQQQQQSSSGSGSWSGSGPGIQLARNDTPQNIKQSDFETSFYLRKKSRCLTVLVMEQYASHLRWLEKGSEEWLFTAFMCCGTLLHEIGHVVYWKSFRAMNKRMTEPYFGGDLEMELGDSFVASIFGGWVPVPVENDRFGFRREGGRFRGGLSWRQHLCWDWHRVRPCWRVGYSIRVDYIAALFDMENWTRYEACPDMLIRPWTLPESCYRSTTLDLGVTEAGLHASAALPDYDDDDGHGQCVWKRRPAADFRIPLYRGLVISEGDWSTASMCVLDPPEPEARDNTALSRIQTIREEMGGGVDRLRVEEESNGRRICTKAG